MPNIQSQAFLIPDAMPATTIQDALVYFTEQGLFCQLEDDTVPRVFWAVSVAPEEEPITEAILDHAIALGLEPTEVA